MIRRIQVKSPTLREHIIQYAEDNGWRELYKTNSPEFMYITFNTVMQHQFATTPAPTEAFDTINSNTTLMEIKGWIEENAPYKLDSIQLSFLKINKIVSDRDVEELIFFI